MKLRNLMLAATLLVVPIAVKAQPVTGPYVNLGIGADFLMRASAHGTDPAFAGSELKGTFGVVGLISGGWGFGNGFRTELELNERYQNPGFTSFPAASGNADVNTYGVMANGFYDFDVHVPWVYPYVGAGVGYELTSLSSGTATNGTAPVTSASIQSSTRGGFAAQGIAGAAFPIQSVPGLSITAEYRFMGVFNDEYFGADETVGGAAGPHSEFKLGTQYHQAALIGIRYAFGVAPPPPPAPAPAPRAAPAPAPARTYLVFFDWDKSDLTARAKQIISEAAQASTSVATTKIQVSGHADTSGTPAYNQALSMRRAQAVGAELVRDGVAQNIIMIQAFGDTRPLVPTGPGVREPQNRRVEIVLQ
jgi:outer membrane protein OmpA-like peptidoglycan-associated protein